MEQSVVSRAGQDGEHFYNVRDMIRDLKAGKLGKLAPQPVAVDQRVEVCVDGKRRTGTVKDVNTLGYARIEVDLATMHEWLPLNEVTPVPFVNRAGQAYRLGCIDGSMKALDMHTQFTPYAAEYQRGYLDGSLGTPAPRIPLGAPVRVTRLGIEGVISGHSTCDSARYRVSWFDRRLWQVRHKWIEKGVITVIGAAENADHGKTALSA